MAVAVTIAFVSLLPASVCADDHSTVVGEGMGFSFLFFKPIQSVKEASLNARKKLFPDVHIPDIELRIVYELYRTAVIEGSALYQCKDEEQAQQWVKHFNRNLPTDRWACVIRENELNILTIS